MKTQKDIKLLKYAFTEVAQNEIKKGYCEYISTHFNWQTCSFKGLKEKLKTFKWNEDLARKLYDLMYGIFFSPSYHNWDRKIEKDFLEKHGYQYDKKNPDVKGCFAILATSIKNDLNKQLHKLTKIHHNHEVIRRSDNNSKSDNNKRKRYGHGYNAIFERSLKPVNYRKKSNLEHLVQELKEKLANAEQELQRRSENQVRK